MRTARYTPCALILLLAFALNSFDAQASTKAAEPIDLNQVSVTLNGEPQVVWKSSSACQDLGKRQSPPAEIGPDSPPRAVRLANGKIVIFSVNRVDLAMEASEALTRFTIPSCSQMIVSQTDPDPSHFNNFFWILSPLTIDGQTLYGLTHEEYHGFYYNSTCSASQTTNTWDGICWYANLLSYISGTDLRFTALGKELRIAAAVQYPFSTSMTRAGIHDPTNIVKNPKDNNYYFIALADAYQAQPWGHCLFRSPNPFYKPWLAWNGNAFAERLDNPYLLQPGTAPDVCTPVYTKGGHLSEIVYVEPLGAFLAIGDNASGFFYTLSSDLITWTTPKTFMAATRMASWKPGDPAPVNYESILDPFSSSPNYDTAGAHPFLYFVKWALRDGKPDNAQKTIVRIPLNINPNCK